MQVVTQKLTSHQLSYKITYSIQKPLEYRVVILNKPRKVCSHDLKVTLVPTANPDLTKLNRAFDILFGETERKYGNLTAYGN